jgi:hypothetical protein
MTECCPTGWVSGDEAGRDNACEQEIPEAMLLKMLENGDQSPAVLRTLFTLERSHDYTDNCHADPKSLKF